jgi:hypothetical protein
MDRINVFEYGEDDHGRPVRRLAGWFDRDRADQVQGRREWDGNNLADVHVGANRSQTLYRTAQGRYVLHTTSAWVNEKDVWQYITPERAREWLTINKNDDVIEEWFGPLEEETGPGRPEIGPATQIRLGPELTERVDAARAEGESRAAAIRRLVEAGLSAQS